MWFLIEYKIVILGTFFSGTERYLYRTQKLFEKQKSFIQNKLSLLKTKLENVCIKTKLFHYKQIITSVNQNQEFKRQGLNISISANLKICNFLDVTLNLTDGSYYPYRKPNNKTLNIDTYSNHPPTTINHLPAAIGWRISDISSNKELFNKAKPHYESALKRKKPAAHTAQNSRQNRQRNIIWFNPPYSMNKALLRNS